MRNITNEEAVVVERYILSVRNTHGSEALFASDDCDDLARLCRLLNSRAGCAEIYDCDEDKFIPL
jgi:hypothetical protein